ncbi:MAG: YwaF family protein [Bacilli bacterium]|nr:YwaF family protein [Bacilli bacterium]
MNTPTAYGWFHLLCIFLVVLFIYLLYLNRKKYNDKQLKLVLFTYGSIALILELLKQLIWTFNYDPATKIITWDYEWYAFPFQLCSTPIYVSLICLFLKKGKTRTALLSYLAYVTILGSISTILIPDSCFTSDTLVNIHTMWLHLGSFVVSVYLLMNKEVEVNITNLKNSIKVFLLFATLAYISNIVIYNLGILNDESFNMFYISPYFESSLPVFVDIQKVVPHIVFLLIYIIALSIGAYIIYFIAKLFSKKRRAN